MQVAGGPLKSEAKMQVKRWARAQTRFVVTSSIYAVARCFRALGVNLTPIPPFIQPTIDCPKVRYYCALVFPVDLSPSHRLSHASHTPIRPCLFRRADEL